MSAWDPWWVHGDYAETYHGAPLNEYAPDCPDCQDTGVDDDGGPCRSCGITEEEWQAWHDTYCEMNR